MLTLFLLFLFSYSQPFKFITSSDGFGFNISIQIFDVLNPDEIQIKSCLPFSKSLNQNNTIEFFSYFSAQTLTGVCSESFYLDKINYQTYKYKQYLHKSWEIEGIDFKERIRLELSVFKDVNGTVAVFPEDYMIYVDMVCHDARGIEYTPSFFIDEYEEKKGNLVCYIVDSEKNRRYVVYGEIPASKDFFLQINDPRSQLFAAIDGNDDQIIVDEEKEFAISQELLINNFDGRNLSFTVPTVSSFFDFYRRFNLFSHLYIKIPLSNSSMNYYGVSSVKVIFRYNPTLPIGLGTIFIVSFCCLCCLIIFFWILIFIIIISKRKKKTRYAEVKIAFESKNQDIQLEVGEIVEILDSQDNNYLIKTKNKKVKVPKETISPLKDQPTILVNKKKEINNEIKENNEIINNKEKETNNKDKEPNVKNVLKDKETNTKEIGIGNNIRKEEKEEKTILFKKLVIKNSI